MYQRLKNKSMSLAYALLAANALQMRNLKKMVKRAMGHKQAKYFELWCIFIRDCRLTYAKSTAALKRWLNRHMAASFRSWALYTHRIKHVRKLALKLYWASASSYSKLWPVLLSVQGIPDIKPE